MKIVRFGSLATTLSDTRIDRAGPNWTAYFSLYTSTPQGELSMAKLTTKAPPLRNLIAMNDELEVKYWTKHLGVSREELQRAVDKVGNSAAAVRKELEMIREDKGLK
jgi:hypothetical protein